MKKKYLLLGILLSLFLLITILVLTNNISSFDNFIYNGIISLRTNTLDTFNKLITKLGNTITIILIVITLIFILKKEDGILLGSSTILSVLLNTIIKYLIKRKRPSHLRLIKQGGYSFPSGHAMISIAVYGLLIYLVNKNIKNKKLKIFLELLLLFIIIGIGLSRIYVGVHYPSDVVAGYLLSTSTLIILISIYNKFRGNLNETNSSK